MIPNNNRPIGITSLSLFFWFGALASFLSSVSVLFPGSLMEPMGQLNPHAREGFTAIGSWAILLMFAVCGACTLAAVGLWRGLQWGYWTALIMLSLNLAGDIVRVITGLEPKALILYLITRRVRLFFLR